MRLPTFIRFFLSRTRVFINPNWSLDCICLDWLLPSCFLTAFVRLPASALPFHLAVARYAFDETSAHLLNNRTKSVKESNDRFGINMGINPQQRCNSLIVSCLENTLFWSTKIPYIAIAKHPILHDQYRVFCYCIP